MTKKRKAPQHTMNTARPNITHKYYTALSALNQIMRIVGLSLFLLGGAAMDSADLRFPIAALAAGAALVYFTTRGEPNV